jgi:hypothetical protein
MVMTSMCEIVAYRRYSASIRVRIVDAVFSDMSITDRFDEVADPVFRELPEDIATQVVYVLLVAPDESDYDRKYEFENPDFYD